MTLSLKSLIAALSAVLFFTMISTAQAAYSNPSEVTSAATAASNFEGKYQGLWHSLCGTASGRATAKIDDDEIEVDVTFKGKEYPFNADIKEFTDGKQLRAKGKKIKYRASLTEDGVLYLFYERRGRSDDCGMMVFNGPKTAVTNDAPSGEWSGSWYSTENSGCAAEGGTREGDIKVEFVSSVSGLVLAHFNVDNAKYRHYSRIFEDVDGTLKHERFVAKKDGSGYAFTKENDQFIVVENGDQVVLKFNVPGLDCGYMELNKS